MLQPYLLALADAFNLNQQKTHLHETWRAILKWDRPRLFEKPNHDNNKATDEHAKK